MSIKYWKLIIRIQNIILNVMSFEWLVGLILIVKCLDIDYLKMLIFMILFIE